MSDDIVYMSLSDLRISKHATAAKEIIECLVNDCRDEAFIINDELYCKHYGKNGIEWGSWRIDLEEWVECGDPLKGLIKPETK